VSAAARIFGCLDRRKKNRAMRQRRARGNLFALDLHTPASSLRMRAVLRRAIETTDVPDRRRWP